MCGILNQRPELISLYTKESSPLDPKIIQKAMLEPTKLLKLSEANTFLNSKASRMNIIHEFIMPFVQVPSDISFLDITIFSKPLIDI